MNNPNNKPKNEKTTTGVDEMNLASFPIAGLRQEPQSKRLKIKNWITTKDGKKFGIGLSLLAQAAEDVGGSMQIDPGPDFGIKITAVFHTDHPDMKPLGDIHKTLRVLQATHPEVYLSFEHLYET